MTTDTDYTKIRGIPSTDILGTNREKYRLIAQDIRGTIERLSQENLGRLEEEIKLFDPYVPNSSDIDIVSRDIITFTVCTTKSGIKDFFRRKEKKAFTLTYGVVEVIGKDRHAAPGKFDEFGIVETSFDYNDKYGDLSYTTRSKFEHLVKEYVITHQHLFINPVGDNGPYHLNTSQISGQPSFLIGNGLETIEDQIKP